MITTATIWIRNQKAWMTSLPVLIMSGIFQINNSNSNKFSETAKDAWLALIEHKKNCGTADWSPGNNIIEFLFVL